MLAVISIILGSAAATMNPFKYKIANPTSNTPSTIPFHGEYFEVLGPETTTQYSQVFWKSQPVDLPNKIIQRFDNKIMAVTGYEVDIVRTNADDNTTTSVASYEIYNHHYSGWMYGKDAEPKNTNKQKGSDDNPMPNPDPPPPMAHGHALPQWEINTNTVGEINYPNVQAFSEGNGNEHRGAYKGYAKGYAQLIKSPKTWSNNPMIINTNKKLTNDASPGNINHQLVPKHSLAPNDSTYSGILECPCTDRKIKILNGYKTSNKNCEESNRISTLNECLAAVTNMGMLPIVSNEAGSGLNNSCTVAFNTTLNGWNVNYGSAAATATTTSTILTSATAKSPISSSELVGSTSVMFSNTSFMNLSVAIQSSNVHITVSGPSTVWFAVAFNATAMSDDPYAIVINGTTTGQKGDVNVEERILGNHNPGAICTDPSSVIKILSHTIMNGIRTITMERPVVSKCFSFASVASVAPVASVVKATTSIPVLLAHGTSATFSYHGKTRASAILSLIDNGHSECICRDPTSNTGTIDGIVFNDDVCATYPTGELLSTKNAICNISRYEGGLYCCHHDSILLDSNQIVPNKTDTWRLKYRFYFEEFVPKRDNEDVQDKKDSHQNLWRAWWSTEATNNEYDVPKSVSNCNDPTTPVSDCIHEIKSQFKGIDMIAGAHGGGGTQCMVSGDDAACGNITLIKNRDQGKFKLMYMAAHCHTPACMSLELWNDDTGELICRNAPTYGNGKAAMNENSYVISIPPCLFGTKEEGLLPPPVLSLDSNLTTIKRANNTNGHWGVMALWQMRGAYVGGNPW